MDLTAEAFTERLAALRSDEELRKIQRYFKTGEGQYGAGDLFWGVRMGQVFDLAKEFIDLPPAEIERLLESPVHEARAGALSIMGKQYGRKKTPAARREELFDLYVRRIDRIDNWDLVDLGALYVVGPHLLDGKRLILFRYANSTNLWERRTAAVAALPIAMKRTLDDPLAIAELLVNDPEELIHKSNGWLLRVIGTKDRNRLCEFLDRHAATMPRTMLRAALEHFEKGEREDYLARSGRSRGVVPKLP